MKIHLPGWIFRKRGKGSFTIEAAVVVPLVMVVLASALILVFYLHDLSGMKAVNVYALMETAEEMEKNSTKAAQIVQQMLSRKLLMAGEVSTSVNAGSGKASVISNASLFLPRGFYSSLLGEEVTTLYSRMEVSNLDGRKKLLLYKSIFDGINSLLE